MTVGIQGKKKKNGLHVPLAIVSTTMCASEVDVNEQIAFSRMQKTCPPLMVLGVITLDRLNFWGVVNPESSTHLPKAHFKDGGRSRLLTMSMHSRYSKGSNFLS